MQNPKWLHFKQITPEVVWLATLTCTVMKSACLTDFSLLYDVFGCKVMKKGTSGGAFLLNSFFKIIFIVV